MLTFSYGWDTIIEKWHPEGAVSNSILVRGLTPTSVRLPGLLVLRASG